MEFEELGFRVRVLGPIFLINTVKANPRRPSRLHLQVVQHLDSV